MSNVVDNRVVSMEFDNARFEQNVQTSLGTIDKLKRSLDFNGASKSLESINSAANGCNMSPLGSAVEAVRVKFSALEVMAVTALTNITNSAVNAGKRLVSAFTIEPIKTGLAEYETQINAVQTILANTQSKGTTLDDVNAALDTLNKYADKTIYNFTEMTRNIGTFTAAGVDLDTSVNAIQGIANLAAISGSNAQQASTAMYQLSQALASGTVKLMDWNSVVNAGMGGQVFQDALKETARVHGIAIDNMIDKHGSFRETLQEGWLTSEILTETLMKFTMTTEGLTEEQIKQNRAMLAAQGYTEQQIDEIFALGEMATNAATKVKTFTQLLDTLKEAAQSGWTQTWELLIGDFEEAKSLWTTVSDVLGEIINKSAESRNKLLGGALESNWSKLVKKINEAGKSTEDFEKSVRDVATKHGYDVDKLVEQYGSLEAVFQNGKLPVDLLKEAITGLNSTMADFSKIERDLDFGDRGEDVKQLQQALLDLGYDLGEKGVDGYIGRYTSAAIKKFQEDNQLEVTGVVDEKTLEALTKATTKVTDLGEGVDGLIAGVDKLGGRQLLLEAFANIWKAIYEPIKVIGSAFRELFPPMTSEQLYKLIEGFKKFTDKLVPSLKQLKQIRSAFSGLFSVIKIVWNIVKAVGGGIAKLLGNFEGLGDTILGAAASIGEWLVGVRTATEESDIFGTVINGVVSFLQKVIDKIKLVYSYFKRKIATPGWEGFVSLLSGLWDFIQKIGGKIAQVGSAIANFLSNAFSGGDLASGIDILNGGLVTAILFNIKKFFGGLTDSAEEGFGLFESLKNIAKGITDTLDTIGESLKTWQQSLKAGTILKIAAAIGILAVSIAIIASIDPTKLAAALWSITVLFADLIGALAVFDKLGGTYRGTRRAATLMIGMSAAVLILAAALKTISGLNWNQLSIALTGIGFLILGLTAAMRMLSETNTFKMSDAIVLISFAAAIKILVSAVKDISDLNWNQMTVALTGIGFLIIGMIAAMKALSSTASFKISDAIVMISFAAAMKILASTITDLTEVSWDQLGVAMAGIGGLIVGLAIVMKTLSSTKSFKIKDALVILSFAAAMKILASTVTDLTGVSWSQLGVAMAGIGGLILGMAVVMKTLSSTKTFKVKDALVILSFAAAMKILASTLKDLSGMTWSEMGVGMAGIGGLLIALALGLKFMQTALPGAAALVVAAMALAILTPVLKALGSMSIESVGVAIYALAGAFAAIGFAGLVLKPLIPTILALSGAFVLLGVGMLAIGAGIAAAAVGFTTLAAAGTAGATAIVAALSIIIVGIIALIPAIATEIGNAIVAFCGAIADGASSICSSVKTIILALIDVLVECIPAIADGALKLVAGILSALVDYTPEIVNSIIDFLINILETLTVRMPELITAAMGAVTAFFAGITDAIMNIDGSTLLKTALGVGIFAVILGALSLLAPLIPGAMGAIAGMAAVVVELGILLAALGLLAQIPGLEWLIGEGGNLLQKIGEALGKFIGGIVGGLAGGALTSFFDCISGMDDQDATKIETFAGVLASLVAVAGEVPASGGLLQAVTGTPDLVKFSNGLSALGTSIKSFSDSISSLGMLDVTRMTTLLPVISSLVAISAVIPPSGGLLQAITGTPSLTRFSVGLVTLGVAIKLFSDSISSLGLIDIMRMTMMLPIISSLVAISAVIPPSGGLLQAIVGTPSLVEFSTGLIALGVGIKSFSDSISELGIADVLRMNMMIPIVGSLVAIAAAIPPSDGLLQAITGAPSLVTFSTGLTALGTAVKSFSESIADITLADVLRILMMLPIISSLVSISALIPPSDGLLQAITGTSSLGSFADELAIFGEKIASFATSISEVTDDDITRMTQVGTAASTLVGVASSLGAYNDSTWFNTSLTEFATELANFGTKMSEFNTSIADVQMFRIMQVVLSVKSLIGVATSLEGKNTSSLRSFGTNLKKLGEGVSDFYDEVSGVDTATLSSLATAISDLAAIDVANADTVQSFITSLGDVSTSGIDAFIKSFSDCTPRVLASVNLLLTKAIKGILLRKPVLLAAVRNVVISASSFAASSDLYYKFYYAGGYLVEGFARGISNNAWLAKKAAEEMAESAVKAAKKALDINSPSKKFMVIGGSVPEGFAKGIDKFGYFVNDSVDTMADGALNRTRNVLARVADVVNFDIDSQPTIRPVLDLSAVSAGAKSIDSMLAMEPSIGVMSNIGTIDYMMKNNQNGTDSEVISAIRSLGQSISSMPSGDTYNINGVTYDDGSNIVGAVQTLVRAAKVERRK